MPYLVMHRKNKVELEKTHSTRRAYILPVPLTFSESASWELYIHAYAKTGPTHSPSSPHQSHRFGCLCHSYLVAALYLPTVHTLHKRRVALCLSKYRVSISSPINTSTIRSPGPSVHASLRNISCSSAHVFTDLLNERSGPPKKMGSV